MQAPAAEGLPGRFITFEGVEGAGKTTQIQKLAYRLTQIGLVVLVTREPGGTSIGDSIRRILLDGSHAEMTRFCELFLIAASRAQHVEEVVRPALRRGTVVLCDRYSDATIAYQQYGRGLESEMVRPVCTWASGGLIPDWTVLLDLPPEEGLVRVQKRKAQSEVNESRFDDEAIAFHRRVRDGYLALSRENPDRIKVFPAHEDPEVLHSRIYEALHGFLISKPAADYGADWRSAS